MKSSQSSDEIAAAMCGFKQPKQSFDFIRESGLHHRVTSSAEADFITEYFICEKR